MDTRRTILVLMMGCALILGVAAWGSRIGFSESTAVHFSFDNEPPVYRPSATATATITLDNADGSNGTVTITGEGITTPITHTFPNATAPLYQASVNIPLPVESGAFAYTANIERAVSGAATSSDTAYVLGAPTITAPCEDQIVPSTKVRLAVGTLADMPGTPEIDFTITDLNVTPNHELFTETKPVVDGAASYVWDSPPAPGLYKLTVIAKNDGVESLPTECEFRVNARPVLSQTGGPSTITTPMNTAVTVGLTVTDSDATALGQHFTGSEVSPPAHGVVLFSLPNATTPTQWTARFTPQKYWHSTTPMTFQVAVSDGIELSAPFTVSVTVNSGTGPGGVAIPVAYDDAVSTVENVISYEIPLTASLGDIESPATYRVVEKPKHCDKDHPFSITGATATYTPQPGWYGTDSFTFLVSGATAAPASIELESQTATVTVTVVPLANHAPTITVPAVKTVVAGVERQIVVSAEDPDGNDLYFSGESEYGTLTYVESPIPGVAVFSYTSSIPETLTFTVTDGLVSDSDTVDIEVLTGDPGPIVPDDDLEITTDEDTPVTIALRGYDLCGEVTYTVDIGGLGTVGTLVTDEIASGYVVFNPSANLSGTCTFTYTLHHGTEESERGVNITVLAVNDPPDPGTHAYTISEDANWTSFDITATDVESDEEDLDYALDAPAEHGTVEALDDAGAFRYKPNANYYGPDSFTFWVTDADGESSEGLVTITVNAVDDGPDVPVADDIIVETVGGTSVAIALTAKVATTPKPTLTYIVVTAPVHGNVSTGTGSARTYTRKTGDTWFGTETFTYTATNGTATSTPATVAVVVYPIDTDHPVVEPIAVTTCIGRSVTIPLQGRDVDDATLSYSFTGTPTPTGYTIATAPYTLLYSGGVTVARIFGDVLKVTPTKTGTVTVNYRAYGTNGYSAASTITITVTDTETHAPTLDISPVSVAPGGTTSFSFEAGDLDPESTLTYAIPGADDPFTTYKTPLGTITDFDPETGEISYEADDNVSGVDAFTVTVTDSDTPAHTVTGIMRITIAPATPENVTFRVYDITSPTEPWVDHAGPVTGTVGVALVIKLNATETMAGVPGMKLRITHNYESSSLHTSDFDLPGTRYSWEKTTAVNGIGGWVAATGTDLSEAVTAETYFRLRMEWNTGEVTSSGLRGQNGDHAFSLLDTASPPAPLSLTFGGTSYSPSLHVTVANLVFDHEQTASSNPSEVTGLDYVPYKPWETGDLQRPWVHFSAIDGGAGGTGTYDYIVRLRRTGQCEWDAATYPYLTGSFTPGQPITAVWDGAMAPEQAPDTCLAGTYTFDVELYRHNGDAKLDSVQLKSNSLFVGEHEVWTTPNGGNTELRCRYYLTQAVLGDASSILLIPVDDKLVEKAAVTGQTELFVMHDNDGEGEVVYTFSGINSLSGWRVIIIGTEGIKSAINERDHFSRRVLAANDPPPLPKILKSVKEYFMALYLLQYQFHMHERMTALDKWADGQGEIDCSKASIEAQRKKEGKKQFITNLSTVAGGVALIGTSIFAAPVGIAGWSFSALGWGSFVVSAKGVYDDNLDDKCSEGMALGRWKNVAHYERQVIEWAGFIDFTSFGKVHNALAGNKEGATEQERMGYLRAKKELDRKYDWTGIYTVNNNNGWRSGAIEFTKACWDNDTLDKNCGNAYFASQEHAGEWKLVYDREVKSIINNSLQRTLSLYRNFSYNYGYLGLDMMGIYDGHDFGGFAGPWRIEKGFSVTPNYDKDSKEVTSVNYKEVFNPPWEDQILIDAFAKWQALQNT
jgi:hypothetical protein